MQKQHLVRGAVFGAGNGNRTCTRIVPDPRGQVAAVTDISFQSLEMQSIRTCVCLQICQEGIGNLSLPVMNPGKTEKAAKMDK